nr:MAG TPA: hypothetical protein [Caudoviricetes sp.]
MFICHILAPFFYALRATSPNSCSFFRHQHGLDNIKTVRDSIRLGYKKTVSNSIRFIAIYSNL